MSVPASSHVACATRLFLKHGVAAAVVVATCVAVTIVTYLGLLVGAVLVGGDLGGPLALPGMVLIAVAASASAVVVALLPVTSVAELLCTRLHSYRWFGEIVVSSVLLVVYVFAVWLCVAVTRGCPVSAALGPAAIVSAFLLVLLGVYWWSMQAAVLLMHVTMVFGARLLTWLRSRTAA